MLAQAPPSSGHDEMPRGEAVAGEAVPAEPDELPLVAASPSGDAKRRRTSSELLSQSTQASLGSSSQDAQVISLESDAEDDDDVSFLGAVVADDEVVCLSIHILPVEEGWVAKAFECPCCREDVPPMTGVYTRPMKTHSCGHMMCCDCFKRLTTTQIEKKELCTCPLCTSSARVVPGWLIDRIVGAEAAKANSENEQLHLDQVDGGQMRFWQCPIPDCSYRLSVPGEWDHKEISDAERVVDCKGCEKRICVRCDIEEHSGISCDKFQEWKRANASVDQDYAGMLQTGIIKPCPNCRAPILKDEGCNLMACTSCKCPNGMCWQTGKRRHGPDNCGGGHNCH